MVRRQKAGESGAKMKAARRLPGGLSGGGHQGAATRRAARGPRSRMHAAQPTPGPGLHPPARRKKRRTASNRAPRTHHWELRNGGGGGGEARGRVRRSQSLPPASFEPTRKIAEGVGRRGEWGGRRGTSHRPREHAQTLSQSERDGRTPAQARWDGGPWTREELPPPSLVQTKQGRERARRRAPEEVSMRGQGARSQGIREGEAERLGMADKRRHLRGPEHPAPSSQGAALGPELAASAACFGVQ